MSESEKQLHRRIDKGINQLTMSGKSSYTNGGFSLNDPKVEAHVVEQLPEQKLKDEKK